MMADFDKAVERTFDFEGGYVNHRQDKGGATKYGISARSYPDEDIENLTLERAKFLYRRDYWDPLKLDQIVDQVIADEFFDTAVNMGLRTAAQIAQEALGYLGVKVDVDGNMGPQTIAAVNSYRHKDVLLKTMNGLQFMRYINIVKVNPEQKVFFRGWLSRIEI